MAKITYPDGSFYYEIVKPLYLNTIKLNSYEDLWLLNQFIDASNNIKADYHILIPWLIDSQADVRFYKNTSYGLKLVCEILNKAKSITVFHPHNEAVLKAFVPHVKIMDNSTFLERVMKSISGELCVVTPDAGSYKSTNKVLEKMRFTGEIYSASKYRSTVAGKTVIRQLISGDFEGKDVLIIDDICVKGRTFIGLSEVLREKGAKRVFLAVSHITIPEVSEDLVNAFDGIYTTNSKYESYGEGVTVIPLFEKSPG